MIAGETEQIIGLEQEDVFYPYDELFGLGGKNKASRKKRERLKKEKDRHKKTFWQGLDGKIKENGGLEGVATSVGKIFNAFGKKDTPPANFQFGVNTPDNKNSSANNSTKGLLLVGGVVALSLALWGATVLSKKSIPPAV